MVAQYRERCFVNWLDLCLLQTDWGMLRITPHAFRQGCICQESLDGVDIQTLMCEGRWATNSDATEHYTRTDFASLKPYELMREFPDFRKTWSIKRLAYLSKNVVESYGMAENHPHTEALQCWCLEQLRLMAHALPVAYPHKHASQWMVREEVDRMEKTFLQGQIDEAEKAKCDFICRREISRRVKARSKCATPPRLERLYCPQYRPTHPSQSHHLRTSLTAAVRPSMYSRSPHRCLRLLKDNTSLYIQIRWI